MQAGRGRTRAQPGRPGHEHGAAGAWPGEPCDAWPFAKPAQLCSCLTWQTSACRGAGEQAPGAVGRACCMHDVCSAFRASLLRIRAPAGHHQEMLAPAPEEVMDHASEEAGHGTPLDPDTWLREGAQQVMEYASEGEQGRGCLHIPTRLTNGCSAGGDGLRLGGGAGRGSSPDLGPGRQLPRHRLHAKPGRQRWAACALPHLARRTAPTALKPGPCCCSGRQAQRLAQRGERCQRVCPSPRVARARA